MPGVNLRVQTFCLVATGLGLAPFCILALSDSKIEKDLGVDGIGEAILHAGGGETAMRAQGRSAK